MIKKSFLLLVSIFFLAHIFADSADIDVPDAVFSVHDGFTVPNIEGFDLDGTGEETVLPFKRMVFGSEVVKVEILKQHKITLEAPLKKGEPLYRLSSMQKVKKLLRPKGLFPRFQSSHLTENLLSNASADSIRSTFIPLFRSEKKRS